MIQFLALRFLSIFDFFHKKKMMLFLKKNKFVNFKVVFDVGAHEGETIDLYLSHFNIEKIYSFEPSYFSFNKLKKVIDKIKNKKNKTQIIIENIALGVESKDIKLKHMYESSSSTVKDLNIDSKYYKKKKTFLLNYKNQNLFSEISVQQKNIDQYMLQKKIQKIDFLKIDTEGSEFEILSGAKMRIKDIKLILFEHHYHDMIKKDYTFSDVHDLLKKNNFEQIYKAKMPFRKTFEYIYINKTY